MLYRTVYNADYGTMKETLKKDPSFENLQDLADWCQYYSGQGISWNGISYYLKDEFTLTPVYSEPDENDMADIIDYILEWE